MSNELSLGSGQVYYPADAQDRDHESHRDKAASATSEVTSLEFSYARIIRDDTAEPATNVAENHNDVLQAANLYIRGVAERPLLQLRKRNLFTGL